MADKKDVEIPDTNPEKVEKNPRMKEDPKRTENAPQKGDDYR